MSQQIGHMRMLVLKSYAAEGILKKCEREGATIKFEELRQALGTDRFMLVKILQMVKSNFGVPAVIVKADGTPWVLKEDKNEQN